jgi:hypothetical protein
LNAAADVVHPPRVADAFHRASKPRIGVPNVRSRRPKPSHDDEDEDEANARPPEEDAPTVPADDAHLHPAATDPNAARRAVSTHRVPTRPNVITDIDRSSHAHARTHTGKRNEMKFQWKIKEGFDCECKCN